MHIQDKECETTVNLLEDVHWLLLITGHFLVSGPASLTSVLRTNSPWETQFSIPQQLLYLGSNATVDLINSRRLILMSVVQTIDLKEQKKELNQNHPPELQIFSIGCLNFIGSLSIGDFNTILTQDYFITSGTSERYSSGAKNLYIMITQRKPNIKVSCIIR
ncbi:unnamed protein product [Trichobilharzia regenti]|nr:unnamed protein product [Trichobilharzia regenti]